MLQSLYVKNLALIEEAEVSFGEGLNILSGETGAGKSILLGSIQIGLGGKVPKDIIRDSSSAAYVELIFHVAEAEKRQALEEAGVFLEEDGQLVISRKLTGGKSISRVNGEFFSASKIADISSMLLDVYGQREHQSLLKKNTHLEILDSFCQDEVQGLKETVSAQVRLLRKIRQELSEMQQDEASRKREIAYLEFALDEIDSAELKPGEDEELGIRYKRLVNQRSLMQGLAEIREVCSFDGRMSAGNQIEQAMSALNSIESFDPDGLKQIHDQLYDLESLISDLSGTVSSYLDDLDEDEGALSELEERLDLIHDLKAKYGSSIPEILHFAEEQREKLDSLNHFDVHRNELLQEQEACREILESTCIRLHSIRKEAARRMEKEIVTNLKELNFLQVQFRVQLTATEDFTESGTDRAEFLISTNPGEPVKPLVQVASGGELSRIMLALKCVLADTDQIPTLIFDEIDAGISGRTAQMVSEKLAYISAEHQILCISHLPQIVSMADSHFLIEKTSDNHSTMTGIRKLNQSEAVKELARLLGGTIITDHTLESAQEMKEMAEKRKEEIRD